MSFVRPLWDLGPRDLEEAGGKALGLARLADLGVEVPPGFVVTSSFFREVRSLSPLEPEPEALAERIQGAPRAELEEALESLGPSPEGYAVRSSCADEDAEKASFAGIHESYLRVQRADIPRFLFRCWASAFSERALAYRRRMRLATDPSAIRMAVVVQRMLRPFCAGVLFTRDPGSERAAILMQAVNGTAEALVQGSEIPATLRLPREGEGDWESAGGVFPLPAEQARELATLSLRLEAAWGCPLDLEWAAGEGKLYFLQARPVTARRGPEAGEASETPAPREDILWTRANLRELLPDLPSPLFASISERIDWAANSRRLGMEVLPGDRMVQFIQGRPYFNLSLITRWMEEFGFPASQFTRALGHEMAPESESHPPARPFRAFLRSPLRVLRLNLLQASTPRRLDRFFVAARAEARRLGDVDLAGLTQSQWVEVLQESIRYTTEFIFHLQLAFNRVSGSLFLVDTLIPARADRERFISAVLAAGDKSISVKQGMDLIRLSLHARSDGRVVEYLSAGGGDFDHFEQALKGTEFLREFHAYLEEYGHRGVHESDPAMPVYSEDPGFLLKTLAVLVADPAAPDPDATRRRQEEAAARAWAEIRWALPPLERLLPVRLLLLRISLRALKAAIAQREQTRFEGMRVSAVLRRYFREAGARLQRGGWLESAADLPLLRLEEIEGALLGKVPVAATRELARARRAEREIQCRLPMPNLLRESEIAGVSERRTAEAQGTESFRGMPVGPGRVEGRAVVLESPRQLDRVVRGDILVTPTLDPSWIPLFTLASGLVVEMGGTLSHGSIIAREYGLPTVVNIPGITRILKTGDRILLDGSAGTIQRLPQP